MVMALCIPGRVHYHATGKGDIAQWTVLTFDDATATRLAALYPPTSEGAGSDPDALRTHP